MKDFGEEQRGGREGQERPGDGFLEQGGGGGSWWEGARGALEKAGGGKAGQREEMKRLVRKSAAEMSWERRIGKLSPGCIRGALEGGAVRWDGRRGAKGAEGEPSTRRELDGERGGEGGKGNRDR